MSNTVPSVERTEALPGETRHQTGGNGHTAFVPTSQLEAMIQQRLQEERARLEREAGIEEATHHHFRRPEERPFTKAQRSHTTVLFGGLTWKHERILHGSIAGLGYKVMPLPNADKQSFQIGKEYGNNGQCNPTYFTVGNLVKYLQSLESQGLTKQEIVDNYVYVTAGACGPCRFGMYEAEYRLALRNAGFDGFRVLLFQQGGGLDQAGLEAGLDLNIDFFIGMLNGMNFGDLLLDIADQIRPFEVKKGETDRVLRECVEYMYEVMKARRPYRFEGKLADVMWAKRPGLANTAEFLGKFLRQLFSDHFIDGLRWCFERLNTIEVDYLRVKPICKVTGEFWAQTTESDGNFNMFPFLDREGAQIIREPIATWTSYLLNQAKNEARDRRGLKEDEAMPRWYEIGKHARRQLDFGKKLTLLWLAGKIYNREYDRLRAALGGKPHALANQLELLRVGHPYYNSRAEGGEGHLEVAKNIYYSNKDLCHMVLSLKPFGCMPSTQSDGAQSAVISHFKDMIFIPIETSGEGDVNAHSRVQMALGEAKAKAKNEFARVLEETGHTLDEIRAYVEAHPEMQRPAWKIPHYKGVVGTAALFVKQVATRMDAEARGGRLRKLQKVAAMF
ncbi:MAG TPA: activator of (R)-2-hydroxyglutaryl-CoA dehydratase [Candidatus Tectomicrobia bacterium]|nr:activator of (R)-2-hydroxyglutaryl-CoA dehydratase [Candidatus Tectomicrobia bacterium]